MFAAFSCADLAISLRSSTSDSTSGFNALSGMTTEVPVKEIKRKLNNVNNVNIIIPYFIEIGFSVIFLKFIYSEKQLRALILCPAHL